MRNVWTAFFTMILFSPALRADHNARSIHFKSDECGVVENFYKKSFFNSKNDSQYVYARLVAEGYSKVLSGVNLNNLGLRVGGRLSSGTYVDSIASVMAGRYPANNSGRVIVNIYWAFPGKVPVDDDSSSLEIITLDNKKPVCFF